MGRFYSGDIEGKFWFAVQASDDASFFGGNSFEPNYINYEFSEDDLPEIKKGIEKCLLELGGCGKKIDLFFNSAKSYTDDDIEKFLGCGKNKVKDLLQWYARLELGRKILKCVEDTGECNFEAEL